MSILEPFDLPSYMAGGGTKQAGTNFQGFRKLKPSSIQAQMDNMLSRMPAMRNSAISDIKPIRYSASISPAKMRMHISTRGDDPAKERVDELFSHELTRGFAY